MLQNNKLVWDKYGKQKFRDLKITVYFLYMLYYTTFLPKGLQLDWKIENSDGT